MDLFVLPVLFVQEVFSFMKNKELALQLLIEKRKDINLTLDDISKKSGYSKRQLMRLSKELDKCEDMEALLLHANTGKEPANKAFSSELEFLREFKKPYPSITIAQFRDIFIEDVLQNPKMKKTVKKYHLQERSVSWFRNLFEAEGWKSPEHRKPLRRDGRALHPLRDPAAQRGLLIQIDGTPFDWLNNGEIWTLHLAVDDATSEVISGYFMPTERQLGYCWMMKLMLEKDGIPMALYSDKHTIFRSTKETGELTQFGQMMDDLGIELIFANSPQAKGRIERYNGTVQRRLPNDIKRFGIKDYDTLNKWFNEFYIPYINQKFAFIPKDPHDAFIPLDGYDLTEIFTLRATRLIRNDSFSLKSKYYSVLDDNGDILHLINGAEVNIRINVFTNEMYILRYGKKHNVKIVRERRQRASSIMENGKDVSEYLAKFKE